MGGPLPRRPTSGGRRRNARAWGSALGQQREGVVQQLSPRRLLGRGRRGRGGARTWSKTATSAFGAAATGATISAILALREGEGRARKGKGYESVGRVRGLLLPAWPARGGARTRALPPAASGGGRPARAPRAAPRAAQRQEGGGGRRLPTGTGCLEGIQTSARDQNSRHPSLKTGDRDQAQEHSYARVRCSLRAQERLLAPITQTVFPTPTFLVSYPREI